MRSRVQPPLADHKPIPKMNILLSFQSVRRLAFVLAILVCLSGIHSAAAAISFDSAASNSATLTVTPVAPSITSQPQSQTVTAGQSATFSVTAAGTSPLSYQWKFGGSTISGGTNSSSTIANVQAANAGSYTAMLSVNSGGSGSFSQYNLTGFATVSPGTTGGGVLADTDPHYAKVSTPQQFLDALYSNYKTAAFGAYTAPIQVIEITADLNLGYTEVGTAVTSSTSGATLLSAHNPPQLHPVLLATGVSKVDIKPKKGGLTIFSANGATIKHATFNVKGTTNIIIRNLKFDEMWEWDETTKGQYDKNDWDFIDTGNGGATSNVWIDHCTFTKTYDGIVDLKAGSTNITFSWCKYIGDDGATNSNSFVRQQITALEANSSSYAFYHFLRTNGFSVEDIVQIIQGHDKTHLMGSNDKDPNNVNLSATFHHQWFHNVWDRAVPRLRAGNVHDYNIYVDDGDALIAKRLRDTRASAMSSSATNTLTNTYSFNPPLNGSI